jgi:L-threonylcarbamoyladenylate synthase
MHHDLQRAAELLHDNRLVAFPTETVYGLGGNALSDAAVAAIYSAKGRPSFNPLIVHVRSLEEAMAHAAFNPHAERLAQRFWPGPLTLVVPRRAGCALSLLVSAGMDTVAIRIPAHPLAQALLAESGLPVAAPSANRSGKISPTTAGHVREELGDSIGMILDGGPCSLGIESTVIDMTGDTPIILRPGSITDTQIAEITGHVAWANEHSAKSSPGMLASHYAPEKPMRLNAVYADAHEALLAFGPATRNHPVCENLSEMKDLEEAAANLFRMLRLLDASDAASIAVMPIPETGLGIAINDRLRRAAAPR